MKSDQEILQTFKIELTNGSLIRIDFFQAESEEYNNGRQADLVVEGILAIINQDSNKSYNFLVDLTKMGKVSSYMSDHAKEVYTKLPQYSMLNKAAVVGKSFFLEMTVNLLMQAAGKGNSFKWFDNIEEARIWLAAS